MPWNDLMAMAGLGDGALVASGHPDLRLENYHVVDHPPFLGLTRSDDGGRSWEVVDLLGDADLHALALVGDQIFGAETTGRIWRLDADGTWKQLGEVEARDLALRSHRRPGDTGDTRSVGVRTLTRGIPGAVRTR